MIRVAVCTGGQQIGITVSDFGGRNLAAVGSRDRQADKIIVFLVVKPDRVSTLPFGKSAGCQNQAQAEAEQQGKCCADFFLHGMSSRLSVYSRITY